MREPGGIQRSTTRIFSLAMIAIGILIIVRTIALGGGPAATGIILGLGFLAAGAARLYIQFRSR
ncbi:MAG TPA: hypothetical protein VG186_12095 [Solirubrobacteraceae bacterium]|nr:hypothetical protein [Solirubrobacteraceae bacterium]